MRLRALLFGALLAAAIHPAHAQGPAPESIPVPGGERGVGFDDLRYSPTLGRVLVPAGGTGSILLVDPRSWAVARIGGFATGPEFEGGHGDGVTSADEGRGYLFAIDRTAQRLVVIDPAGGRVVPSAKLSGSPDYVRYVEPVGEVWVTEPDSERIEVFRLEGNPPRPVTDGSVEVKGGPEALVVDPGRGVAFTNLWKGDTAVVTLKNRTVSSKWKNGCEGSRGLALDAARGLLFVGCAEGKAISLEEKSGKRLASVKVGAGVDIIDYSAKLGHLYVPGGKSATMAILSVAPGGSLRLLDTVPTAEKGHCVVADESGNAYVCDPKGGRILVIPDRFERTAPSP